MKRGLSLVLLGGACLLAGCGGSGASLGGPQPPASLVGSWGGGTTENPAALSVTANGGTLRFSCGAADQLTEPLTTDGQGNFSVAATQNLALPVVPARGSPAVPIHLAGTVSGRTMTMHEVYASGAAGTTYMLTFGQAAPQFNGPCPG